MAIDRMLLDLVESGLAIVLTMATAAKIKDIHFFHGMKIDR